MDRRMHRADLDTYTHSHFISKRILFQDIMMSKMEEKNYFILTITLIFLSFFILSHLVPLHAQTYEMEFERISIEQGLSQSAIFCTLQDRQGFLWFGTQDGLNKYDGYSFMHFKHISDDSTSISDNWISALCEDHLGNIWIGTMEGGLNKYDPVKDTFTTYLQEEANDDEGVYNRIQAVFEDSDHILWIGTAGGGLNRFDPGTAQFNHFRYDEKNVASISSDDVTSILEDEDGHLWIGTNDGGISVLRKKDKNEGVFYRYLYNPRDPYSLSSDRIFTLFVDSYGKLWIGTDNGLNLFDPINKQFWRFQHNPRNEASLSNNFVYSMFEDKNHILWIGTDMGLNFYDQARDKFSKSNHDPSNPNSLSNDVIRSIYKDRSGTIWVGTYGDGLNHFDWRKRRFRYYKNIATDPTSLNDSNVWSMLLSRSGQLWVGTNKGLNVINRSKRSRRIYRHNPLDPNSLSDDIVRAIYEDSRGDIWFGTMNGGLNKFNPLTRKFQRYTYSGEISTNSISHNTVRALLEDRNGNLWIGTWGGLNLLKPGSGEFTHFSHDPNDTNSISDDRVRALYQDENGLLWIGTYNGLNRFDPKTGLFKSYIHNPEDSTTISHDRILAVHGGKDGKIWIATYGGGLNEFDPQNENFKAYTEEDGLPNNTIYGILEDEKRNLWLSTNKGLSRFNLITYTFTNFDVNDGLQSDEFNGGAYAKGSNGEMFFGGINGYNSFQPDQIIQSTYIAPIVLTSFRIFDNEVSMDTSISYIKNINLSYSDNFFSFEFAALDYSNPEKNQYLYKLEGFDKDWIRSGNRRYVKYTNLDGGSYTFRVKGTNSDGVWNETGKRVNIVIVPPFWATWWFRIITVVLILSIVYMIYNFRMKKIEKQKKFLEEQIAERTWEINERNRQLIISKKDTDNILHNVEEGIFLLNGKFQIGAQHSSALANILNQERPARKNFLDILENTVTHKVHTSITEFLELMFKDDVEEDALVDLNPMSQIKITFEDAENQDRITKHLAFNFKRIPNEDGQTDELIVTVNDVSNQIRLAQELEESQESGKKQIEWMLSILHVEPQLLKEFLDGANLELNYMDEVLQGSEREDNLIHVLEKMYRSMHLIKGNAALVDLKFFIEKAHEFEENISHIKEKETITGSDFVPLVLMLKEMRSILKELDKLIDRIGKVHMNFRPKRSYEKQLFIASLQNLVRTLAQDMHKQINLRTEEFDAVGIPYRFRLMTRQILIQLIRNSVYHGIEDAEERTMAGKESAGTIDIESMISENAFGFRLRDDGRGIQIDRLRTKARESGRWSEEEINEWDDDQIAETIFTTGISTLDQANLIAGRGVGMDLVKEKVTAIGGQISINTEKGGFCEFIVTIPINNTVTKEEKKELVVPV